MNDFYIKLTAITFVILILAYYIPGLALRAIRDFINRQKGGGTDGKKEMEKGADKQTTKRKR